MKNKKSIVLLSGGLDSGINLALAHKQLTIEMALFINYGQKNVNEERKAAQQLANHFNCKFVENNQRWLGKITNSSLTSNDDVPTYKHLSELGKVSAQQVWVANRNAFFINIAAVYAESLNAKYIITGFNREEAKTFSDNSVNFVIRSNRLFRYSTQNKVLLFSFTQNMVKDEIVKIGKELNFPFDLLYSCYQTGDKMCGKCESCIRLKNALKNNGILDKYSYLFEN